MKDITSIVDKILTDATFCAELVAAPESTLRAHQIEPTADILAALRAMDASALQRLAVAFGKQQAAA